MKFGLRYCNTGRYVDPARAVELVQAAEAAGFESAWTVEHTVIPHGYQSVYPYSPTGRIPGGDGDFDLPVAEGAGSIFERLQRLFGGGGGEGFDACGHNSPVGGLRIWGLMSEHTNCSGPLFPPPGPFVARHSAPPDRSLTPRFVA